MFLQMRYSGGLSVSGCVCVFRTVVLMQDSGVNAVVLMQWCKCRTVVCVYVCVRVYVCVCVCRTVVLMQWC